MTSWNINDGTNNFDVYDVKVTRQLAGLNYAEMNVICDDTTKPIVGASSTLTFGATTVFVGYVNELKKKTYGEYTLKLTEIANDLKYFYVHTGTIPSESRVVIVDNSSGSPLTFGDYIDTILNGTEWTDGSDSTYRNATTNPITSAIFDDVMFNNMTVYDALVQMVETTCGYYCWFNNSAKTVHYGPKDTLVTGRTNHGDLSASIIETYTEDSNVNHNVDRIIVVSTVNTSDGAEYEGSYPTTGLPTYPKTLIYQYEDVVSDGQAATIAQQIYNERNSIRDRFELKLLPTLLSINEGDIISYDSVSYSVIDVTIADSDVTVGLKYFKESIFDRLGDKIKLVSGVSTIGSDATFDCSPQNIPIYDSGDESNTIAVWSWNIADINNIGADVTITPHIEPFKAQSYQDSITVTNNYISIVAPVYQYDDTLSGVTVTTDTTIPSTSGRLMASSGFTYGCDFVLITAYCDIENGYDDYATAGYVRLEYSWNSSTWYDAASCTFAFDSTEPYHHQHITLHGLAIGYGSSSGLYLRLYARNDDDNFYSINATFSATYKSRHTHGIHQSGASTDDILTPAQVDEVVQSSTAPPTYVGVKVNSGGWVSIYNDTESINNFKSVLTSGQNKIYVKSSTKCNVGLTVNYQTYGSGV